MTIEELAYILNGKYNEEYRSVKLDIRGAVVDSREAFEGALFFCISGSVVDGHDYIDSAYANGAILAIVEREIPSPLPYIIVENVVEALGKLANYKRMLYPHVVIAITGSSGKTTAKEILTHILEAKGTVSKNPLNHNNQIGMPLSILNADENAIAWVLELGISEAHDMSELGAIACPTIVYITNAGNAHTQGLGEKGVAYHKASLLGYMAQRTATFLDNTIECMAVIPQTEHTLIEEAHKYDVVLHSVSISSPICIEYQGIDALSANGIFKITYNDDSIMISIPYRGYFMQETLSCLFDIALYLGMDFSSICERLTTLTPLRQRNSVIRHNNIYVIDDTYNANPISMKAMIESIYSYPAEHYILMLGDMNELGDVAEEEHRSLGAYIAYKSTNTKTSVLWKGIYAEYVKQGLLSATYTGSYYINPSRAILEQLIQENTHTVILCKGSRSIALENELQQIYSIVGVPSRDI